MDKPLSPKSPEFRALVERFQSKLRDQLITAYKARRPIVDVERDVFVLLREENLASGLRRALERELKATSKAVISDLKDEFVETHTLRDPTPITNLIGSTLEGYSRLETKIERRVISDVRRAFTEGATLAEITNRIEARLGTDRHQVETLARTGLAAVSRATTIATAVEAGIDRFRLSGPSPQRDFCRDHYQNVYSIAEIELMDNRQGLPVRDHCGGYNCKHFWLAVVKA